MDATYIGKYGDLKAASLNLLSSKFIDQLTKKGADEFLPTLGQTSYRKEIDQTIKMYEIPDSIEVAINTHMVNMLSHVFSAIPPLAKDFIYSYMGKWDVENIKVILSSKFLNYDVEQTEAFLVVQHKVPISLISGVISDSEYRSLIEQKSVEDVVNSLIKSGYGTILLKNIESFRKGGDLSEMMLSLDMYYYSNILKNFKFYNGDEGSVIGFIKELIDSKNILSIIKAKQFGYKNIQDAIITGGNLSTGEIHDILAKPDIKSIKSNIPFSIDWAFEMYKKDPLLTYFDSAMKRAIYSKYMKIFNSISSSLSYIMWFILRCEIERDELRTIWLNKYYKISGERADSTRLLKYIE